MLTVSEVRTLQHCPALWAYKHVAQRRPRGAPAKALHMGTIIHRLLELQPEGSWEDAGEAMARQAVPSDWEGLDQFITDTRTLAYFAQGYASSLDWSNVLAKELTLSRGEVQGKIDCLVQYPSGLKHRQYKTLSPSINPSDFAKAQELAFHEALYADLIQREYPGVRYLGTELVIFRKLARCRKQAGATDSLGRKGYMDRDWTDAVEVFDIPVDPALSQRAFQSLNLWNELRLSYTDRLVTWGRINRPPVPAADSNACLLYNQLCPFHGVCAGTDRLDDELLFESFNPEERYLVDTGTPVE